MGPVIPSFVHGHRVFLLALCLGFNAAVSPCAAQDEDRSLEPLNRLPRMVHEYFVSQVRQIEVQADRDRAALSTRNDAELYVQTVRDKIRQSFGPYPERTPLKPRITGVVERDLYRIEKIVFESRPEFLVTANLYVPKDRDFPLPGVVGTCGHSLVGKAEEAYQSFAQGLARQGYVVLLYDPISQGERLQYPGQDLSSEIGAGVREHLYAGNQQFLVDEFIGSWRAWDGIRALDYLLTRKEVDPNRVGVTGNSGGGTMTTWLIGWNQGWTMAAPSCFVTTFRRNLENELPADTEQCPPRALALGLDHSDWIAAMAPKPVILLAKEMDYFDVRGSETAYHRLRHLYSLLGAEQNIELFIGPTYHGYSQENRVAMYRWFNGVTGVSEKEEEPTLVMETPETLWCAPNGQVCELGSRPIYEFTAAKSRALARRRASENVSAALQQSVREALRLSGSKSLASPYYRILRNQGSRGYPKPQCTTYLIETEPGISAVVSRLGEKRLLSRPRAETKRAILYVAHLSSDAELREEPLLSELIRSEPESTLFTVDVRGTGESQPNTTSKDSFLEPYGSDYFYAIHSIMLDRPYIGQKTYDVLRVLDWLGSVGYDQVHLVGKGRGAMAATFAGILSDRVTQVTLKNAPASYAEMAESKYYNWPLSALVPGVLALFDLPDCYRALDSKRLRQIEPWGPDAEALQ